MLPLKPCKQQEHTGCAASSSEASLFSALLRKADRTPEDEAEMEEHAALSVLHRWGDMNEFLSGAIPLVPEHVEIRPLQNYSNPGLPQVIRGTPAVLLQ